MFKPLNPEADLVSFVDHKYLWMGYTKLDRFLKVI